MPLLFLVWQGGTASQLKSIRRTSQLFIILFIKVDHDKMSRPAHPMFLERKHHIYVLPENRASLKDAEFEVQNSSDLRLKLSAKPHFGAGFGALAQRAPIDAVEGGGVMGGFSSG